MRPLDAKLRWDRETLYQSERADIENARVSWTWESEDGEAIWPEAEDHLRALAETNRQWKWFEKMRAAKAAGDLDLLKEVENGYLQASGL